MWKSRRRLPVQSPCGCLAVWTLGGTGDDCSTLVTLTSTGHLYWVHTSRLQLDESLASWGFPFSLYMTCARKTLIKTHTQSLFLWVYGAAANHASGQGVRLAFVQRSPSWPFLGWSLPMWECCSLIPPFSTTEFRHACTKCITCVLKLSPGYIADLF